MTNGINATCDNEADYYKYYNNQFITLIEGLHKDDDDTAKLFKEVQNAVKYTREGGIDSDMQKFNTTRTAANNVKTDTNRKNPRGSLTILETCHKAMLCEKYLNSVARADCYTQLSLTRYIYKGNSGGTQNNRSTMVKFISGNSDFMEGFERKHTYGKILRLEETAIFVSLCCSGYVYVP